MSFNNKQLHMNPQQSGKPVPADGLNPEGNCHRSLPLKKQEIDMTDKPAPADGLNPKGNCQQLSPFVKEEHDG